MLLSLLLLVGMICTLLLLIVLLGVRGVRSVRGRPGVNWINKPGEVEWEGKLRRRGRLGLGLGRLLQNGVDGDNCNENKHDIEWVQRARTRVPVWRGGRPHECNAEELQNTCCSNFSCSPTATMAQAAQEKEKVLVFIR
jgi:hypothetical protein